MRAFVALLSAFLGSIWLATRLYPGGTWFDRTSPGFSFWGNFWCDLLHPVSFNGADNSTGMWCAKLSFWLFAAALVCFWPLASRLADSPAVQRATNRIGSTGALLLVLVTVFSSRTQSALHGVFVVSSLVAGMLAATVLSLGMYRSTDWGTRLLSLTMMASGLVNLVQYVSQGLGAAPALWLAGTQKISTVLLIAFMLRCAWLVYRRGTAESDQAVPA